ncbi:hypothetical protein EMIT0P43_10120 [Pseudomonas jessenii]
MDPMGSTTTGSHCLKRFCQLLNRFVRIFHSFTSFPFGNSVCPDAAEALVAANAADIIELYQKLAA